MTELSKSCRHRGSSWTAADHGDIDVAREALIDTLIDTVIDTDIVAGQLAEGVGGAQGSSSPTNDTPAVDSRAYAPRQ
jgi:hypothetical protein